MDDELIITQRDARHDERFAHRSHHNTLTVQSLLPRRPCPRDAPFILRCAPEALRKGTRT